MNERRNTFTILLAAALLSQLSAPAEERGKRPKNDELAKAEEAVLWNDPADIASRNLFYGPGGRENAPQSPYIFLKEDLEGSSPKFDVRDGNQIEWKVKMGPEARPETVATRLVWAIGYFANEDYFLQELKIEKLPARLHRGQKLIAPDGSAQDVRLKRHSEDDKKVGSWRWGDNPFLGTRELNGLRVMMALINNWDLKDVNNAIYKEKRPTKASLSAGAVYMVSDLGASFGDAGINWPASKSKGNLEYYSRSKFIKRIDAGFVDFNVPHRPAIVCLVSLPQFVHRLGLRKLGRHIPRSDARWVGQLLARLSPDQIRDAFRAAGYSPQEVEGFTQVVLRRIAELNDL